MNQNLKAALIVGGIIILALIVMSVTIGYSEGWQWFRHGMMGPGMMRGGFISVMIIVWIVIIGLIIWAVVAATQNSGKADSSGTTEGSALDILNNRYARGEISRDEYLDMKKDLKL